MLSTASFDFGMTRKIASEFVTNKSNNFLQELQ